MLVIGKTLDIFCLFVLGASCLFFFPFEKKQKDFHSDLHQIQQELYLSVIYMHWV